MAKKKKTLKRQTLQVAQTSKGIYMLDLEYDEADITTAVGHIFLVSPTIEDGEMPVTILSTNVHLSELWISPSEALWVASTDGVVGTDARVKWPAATGGVEFLTLGPSPKWSATMLPRVKSTGLPPNVTAIWGTSDSNVYLGSYGGHIYHWDGKTWSQVYEGPGKGNGTIRAFGGSAKEMYAVGVNGTVLYSAGKSWKHLDLPGKPNGLETFVGVRVLATGIALIAGSGDQGRLLEGSAGKLIERLRTPIELIGMSRLKDRIFFATGNGIAELIGKKIEMIKSTFNTQSTFTGLDRVFFIKPNGGPGYIQYDPREGENDWWGMTFDQTSEIT